MPCHLTTFSSSFDFGDYRLTASGLSQYAIYSHTLWLVSSHVLTSVLPSPGRSPSASTCSTSQHYIQLTDTGVVSNRHTICSHPDYLVPFDFGDLHCHTASCSSHKPNYTDSSQRRHVATVQDRHRIWNIGERFSTHKRPGFERCIGPRRRDHLNLLPTDNASSLPLSPRHFRLNSSFHPHHHILRRRSTEESTLYEMGVSSPVRDTRLRGGSHRERMQLMLEGREMNTPLQLAKHNLPLDEMIS